MTFGFILSRRVQSESQDQLWRHCYACLRKLYEEETIVIIDDESSIPFHSNDIHDIIYIQSTIPGRGELLPYYYFYRHRFFDVAVVLHDSMFLNQRFDFDVDDIKTVRFLFGFEEHEPYYRDYVRDILHQILHLNPDIYDEKQWVEGCFGTASILHHDFITKLAHEYHFFDIMPYITGRFQRMCLERIFSIVCYVANHSTKIDHVYCKNIVNYMQYGTTFQEYLDHKEKYTHLSCVKVWSGR
uniref:Glycosyltransferase n=1 Tax=viral metagenome TaxID=1070528 RepID=A0A6C0CQL9_9ZZZZ